VVHFIERTIADLSDALERTDCAGHLSRGNGLLQGLDARAKLCGLMALLLAVVAAKSLGAMFCIFALGAALGAASRTPARLMLRLWLGVFLFTGAIAFPAIFLTPGSVAGRMPFFGWPVTETGLRTASQLLLRAETAATLGALLILSTPWTQLLKALRAMGAPALFILMLGMTHRYILLFCRTAHDMFEARRSRLIGLLDPATQRRLAAANGGVLLSKSLHLGGEVYLAMQSRGFRGEARTLDEPCMALRDWGALAAFLAIALLAVVIPSA
jgi:cobalt ECF transporter T component CbiQ